MDYEFYRKLQEKRIRASGGTPQDVKKQNRQTTERFKSVDRRQFEKDSERAVQSQINAGNSTELIRRTQPQPQPSMVGGFVKDATRFATNIAESGARAFGAGRQDELNRANNSLSVSQDRILQVLRNPDIPQQRKDLLMGLLNDQNREMVQKATENTQTVESQTDKSKFLGSVAEGASYFVGGGSLRTAAKGGRAALARTAATTTGAGAVGGAGFEMGRNEDATLGDIAKSAGIGAGLGLGGSVALTAAGGAARASGRAIKSLDDAANKAGSKGFNKLLDTTPGQKVRETITAAQKKIQNTTAPINQELNRLQKQGKLTESQVKNVKSLIQTSRYSSNGMAESWMKGETIENIAEGSKNVQRIFAPIDGKLFNPDKPTRTQKQFLDYWAAKGELEQIRGQSAKNRNVNKRRLAQAEAKVAELENDEFLERFNASVGAYNELADLMVQNGLVSQQQVNYWRSTNQLYNRIQRDIEGMSEYSKKSGSGRAPSSRGSTVGDQKVKGSSREVVNPASTLIDYTNTVFREINSNKAASALIDALQEGGALGKGLRVAEKVLLRQDLMEALKYSKPLQRQLTRFNKTQGKYVRRIQSELNQLNRQGLDASLSRPLDDNLAGKLADPGAKMTKRELDSVLENIVDNTDSKVLTAVRKKIAKTEPKVAQAIQELQDIKASLRGVNAERKLQFDDILKNADEKTNSRPTIQRRVDGVKEIYETTPEIEMAAKGFGPVYMGALGRIVAAPVRFMQTTITGGLNPAWSAIALPRDYLEGVVLSRYARQTHSPANVIGTVAEMVGKDADNMFQKFMSYERGASSVIDLTNAAKNNAKVARQISRQQLPKTSKVSTVVKSPSDFWGVIQDTAKWNEYLGKYQNFRGTYNKLIQEGTDPETAFNLALYEGRNATGNLLEQGDWTRVMAAGFPYFNPTIQGGTTLAKAFRDRPLSTTAKVLMAVQIPAVVSTAWNMSDPRRAEIYLNLSPEERERYTVFILPGSEKVNGKWQTVKIPKPPGVGSLANPIERMMVGMYGQDPGDTENFAQSIIKAFGSPIDPGSVSAAAGSAIPLQLKVPIQGVTNYNFYKGQPIIPDWIKDQNPDEPYLQAFPNTSPTFKKIGKALGISPLLVEQFTNDTSGEFGRNVTYLSDYGLDLAGLSESGERGGRSPVESLTRAYSGSYGSERQKEVGATLDRIVKTKPKISSQVTEALRNNDIDTANRLAIEHNRMIDELESLVGEGSDIRKLSDGQKRLLQNMRFPIENGRLTDGSIKARLNN